jgi:hypothetical protein
MNNKRAGSQVQAQVAVRPVNLSVLRMVLFLLALQFYERFLLQISGGGGGEGGGFVDMMAVF